MLGWIDPGSGRFGGRLWGFIDEAGAVLAERAVERVLACGMDGIGLTEVDLVGGHQPNAAVVVLIVPIEEAAAECPGILDAPEGWGTGVGISGS